MERFLLQVILAAGLLLPAPSGSAQIVSGATSSTVFVTPSPGLTDEVSGMQQFSDPFATGSTINSRSILAGTEQGMMLFYPNPVASQARILLEYPTLTTTQVFVVDLRGQVMRSFSYAPGSYTLDVDMSPLATGIYNVRVINNRNISNIKVVKE